MKYIAIKLKKINLRDGSILFDPVSAVKGIYNKKSDIFIDDGGNKYHSIINCHPESKFCFFEPLSIDFLRKRVGNLMSIDELISEHFYEYIGSIFIGIHDNTNNKVKYIEIYLDKISDHLYHGTPLCEDEYIDYLGSSKEKKYVLDLISLLKIKHSDSLKEVRSYIDDLLKKDSMLDDFNKNNKINGLFNLKWTTPYSVLGIEENKYTKSQLLKMVKIKIDEINLLKIPDEKKRDEINSILDSYNEIIEENEIKTKKLH